MKREIQKRGQGRIRGLFILSPEGVNAGFCGPADEVKGLEMFLIRLLREDLPFKNFSISDWSYKRLSLKIKPEISAIGRPGLASKGNYLTAEEWERESRCAQILDVRNHYEVEAGHFQGAAHLNLHRFRDFPEKLREASFLDKKRKTLICCTGGIRCEKAQRIMEEQGFQSVFQLKGGILGYLKTHPQKRFHNECFVFDHRAAVDQSLRPSQKYRLCWRCGQAGDVPLKCLHCGGSGQICARCREKGIGACSKNCAYHLKMGHRFKKKVRAACG